MAPSGRETALAATLLFVLLATPGFLLRSAVLWKRPLWLDEVHTSLVAQQRDLHAVVSSLSRGADFNPPLLFAWHWAIGQVVGGVRPGSLRLTALFSTWAAVLLVFLFLRRSFGPVPSLVGALAVASQKIVLTHAYEGRFYGPMLLLVAVFVGAVSRAIEQPKSVAAQIGACVAGSLLCLIHYFGIIALGLVVLGTGLWAWVHRRDLRPLLPSVVVAILMLASVSPMYFGQRAALSIPTWVAAPTASSAWTFVVRSLVPLPLALLLLLAMGALVARGLLGRAHTEKPARLSNPRFYGLLSLALLPIVLLTISVTFQPVARPRYAIAASLALGATAALASSSLRGWVGIASAMGFALVGFIEGRTVSANAATFAGQVRADSLSASAILANGGTVAATRRIELYPLLAYFPERLDQLVLATVPAQQVRTRFPEGSDSVMVGSVVLLEQDVARVHARLFGLPRMLSPDSLVAVPCLFFLEDKDRPSFASRWMPDAALTRIRPRLFRLARPSSQANTFTCAP